MCALLSVYRTISFFKNWKLYERGPGLHNILCYCSSIVCIKRLYRGEREIEKYKSLGKEERNHLQKEIEKSYKSD